MFRRYTKIVENSIKPVNYIENSDIYNSSLIYELTNPNIEKVNYEITVYEYRPDLIAEQFYGSKDYLPYIFLSSGVTLEQLKKGNIIKLIPKDILDNIIKSQ